MKTILKCTVGSTLFGTSTGDGQGDLDLMSVVLEPAPQVLGFQPKDTWVERSRPEGVRSQPGDVDHTAYGLRKFLSLALKGNPTILMPLFAPAEHTEVLTEEGAQLRALVPKIISKDCYAPFRGYMHQQRQKLLDKTTRPELVERYGYDTKNAGHIVRLGQQGAELLRTGNVTLPMPDVERQLVLSVRQGCFSLDTVTGMIGALELELSAAYNESTLRDKPDYDAVEAWMIQAYRTYWGAP